jgi:hypothetical protein
MARFRPEFEGVIVEGQTLYLLGLLEVNADERHVVSAAPTDARSGARLMLGFLSARFEPGDVMELDGAEYDTIDDATLALRAYCRTLALRSLRPRRR